MAGRRPVSWLLALVVLGSVLSVVLAVTRPEAEGAGVLPGSGPTYEAATLLGPGGEALTYAVTAVPLVLSYDHRDLDASLDGARSRMTLAYGREFARIFDRQVRPLARERRAMTEAVVGGAGVIRTRGDDGALCLLYVDQVLLEGTGLKQGETEVLARSRVVVELVRRDRGWLIAGLRIL